MIPVAVIAAYRDVRLKRRDLIVYAHALESLSFYQPKTFKVRAVARVAGVHWSHAAASVRRLCGAGYLERGNDEGALHTFLLRTVPKP